MVSNFTAVFDACVLYPAPLRSFLMYLALTDMFRAKWTAEIHEEWMRNVEKDYGDISRKQCGRKRSAVPFSSPKWSISRQGKPYQDRRESYSNS